MAKKHSWATKSGAMAEARRRNQDLEFGECPWVARRRYVAGVGWGDWHLRQENDQGEAAE